VLPPGKSKFKMKRNQFAYFRFKLIFLQALVGGLLTFSAWAHDPGLSSATITILPGRCEATVVFSKVDAAIIFQRIANGNANATAEQLVTGLEKYFADSIALEMDGEKIPANSARGRADTSGNVIFSLGYECAAFTNLAVRSGWISVLPRGHREFISFKNAAGKELKNQLLSADSNFASLEIEPAATIAAEPAHNSFLGFVAMGVEHIWTGYDHLLFLFGLLAVTRNLRTVIKIITCFTVAHSLTLALAALNVVNLSSRLVEPAIAASIVFVGVENFLRNGEPKGRWLLTLLFGLIHGFGFASALREAGVGEHGGAIALPLFAFNLGIELGQLAVAALALPLIWKLREQPVILRRWIPATSTVVVALGTWWLVERTLL
jgi:hydrogenase/urease accessory protein HupE